jgi:hypothetical protein
MANIFAILTSVVLLISAFLAWKNLGTDEPKVGYKGWILARQDMEGDLERNENKLADTKQELAETDARLAETNSQVDDLQIVVDALLAENDSLKQQEADKKAEAETKRARVDEARQKTAAAGDIESAVREIKSLQSEIETFGLEIGEKEAELARLEGVKTDTQGVIDTVNEKIRYRVTQESEPELVTSVVGVFQNLGFVTLGDGDERGVVKDSTLNVVRDGEVIGKLLVTTVERTTAAAGIVPDSFVDGARPRVGDKVVPAAAEVGGGAPPVNPEPQG